MKIHNKTLFLLFLLCVSCSQEWSYLVEKPSDETLLGEWTLHSYPIYLNRNSNFELGKVSIVFEKNHTFVGRMIPVIGEKSAVYSTDISGSWEVNDVAWRNTRLNWEMVLSVHELHRSMRLDFIEFKGQIALRIVQNLDSGEGFVFLKG